MIFFILFVLAVVIVAVVKFTSSQGGKAANARLRGYGVVVDDDMVKRAGRVLGSLAGATAEVTTGTNRHTLTRTVTVVGAATKKTNAAVIISTPEGGIHQQNIQGAGELRRAQAWTSRFNAMAAAQAYKGAAAGGAAAAGAQAG